MLAIPPTKILTKEAEDGQEHLVRPIPPLPRHGLLPHHLALAVALPSDPVSFETLRQGVETRAT